MKPPALFLPLLVFFAFSASASENIRVAVLDNQKTVTVTGTRGLQLENSRFEPGLKKIVFTPEAVANKPVRITATNDLVQVNGKSYRGRVELRKKKNDLLLVINELDIEDYLKGVIASEVPHDWELEALKAQAVASRTFAIWQKRTSGSRAYHLLATVNGQVYEGVGAERERAVRAVQETKGTVLTYEGEVIEAFYHASCGGQTENAMELWGIDEPYLRSVDCECQEISPYGLWEKRFTIPEIVRAIFGERHPIRNVTGVKINGVTEAGRVKKVSILSTDGPENIAAEKFRAAIGYSSVPSLFFDITMSGAEVIISGRGLGHGVGLCQWGAQEMALRGVDFQTILFHYYPGTSLSAIKNINP